MGACDRTLDILVAWLSPYFSGHCVTGGGAALPPQPVDTPASALGVLPKLLVAVVLPGLDPQALADVPPRDVLPQELVGVEPNPDVEDRPDDAANPLLDPPNVEVLVLVAAALVAAEF